MKTIHVTRRLAYPQEMVWAALTDSQRFCRKLYRVSA